MKSLLWFVVASLAAPAAAQSDIGAGQAMVNAIADNCLPKLADGGEFVTDSLTEANETLRDRLMPADTGDVWHTDSDQVVVLNPNADYTCQVLGEGIDLREFSDALGRWLGEGGSSFERDGRLPLSTRNVRGIFLKDRAEDGDHIVVHITNIADDRLGALAMRLPDSRDTRSYLGQ